MDFYRRFFKTDEEIFSKTFKVGDLLISQTAEINLGIPPISNTRFPLKACTNSFNITMEGPAGLFFMRDAKDKPQ